MRCRPSLVVLSLVALVGPSALAADKARVVVLNFRASDPGLQQLAGTLSEQVLTELVRRGGIDAMGENDLSSVLGLERQKQLLGCADDKANACMSELSAALGAPWLVSGAIARLGKAVRVDLKLVRTADGASVFRDGKTTRDEAEVFEVVTQMMGPLTKALLPQGTSGGSVSAEAPARWPPFVVMGGGLALAVAGAIVSGLAATQWSNLNDATWKGQTSWVVVERTGREFNTHVVAGPVLLGAGVAALAGGLVWFLTGNAPSPAKVSVTPTLQGVAVGGVW